VNAGSDHLLLARHAARRVRWGLAGLTVLVAVAVAVGGMLGLNWDEVRLTVATEAPVNLQPPVEQVGTVSVPRVVPLTEPTTATHDTPAAQQGVAREALVEVARRGAQARQAGAATAAPAPVEAAALAGDGGSGLLAVGQRQRVSGAVMQRVAGEAGVQVLMLATATGGGQPLVWSALPEHAAGLEALQPGQPVVVDCLVQGSVMGRWLLADCHL
jgi:hypothetical protein